MESESSDHAAVTRHISGALAEDAAEAHLRSNGHRVLGRNIRLGHLEVDLVTIDPSDGSLVICEVKARRGNHHAPELRVDRTKRRHLVTAAAMLLQRPALRQRAVRFDVIAVQLDDRGHPMSVRHLARAFDAGDV